MLAINILCTRDNGKTVLRGLVSIGLSGLAFFHLLTHALFKALLFMCAGGVIHSMGDSVLTGLSGQLSS